MAHKYMQHQNEILKQKIQERTEVIHHTRLQVVRRLGMAAEYLDEETGLHIDPTLVDIFLGKLPEIIEIREKHAEPD